MDQTIRKILELDAATEESLSASARKCQQKIEDARKKAAAIRQAQRHQTRDAIIELEEQVRQESEQKISELRLEYDRRAEAMTKDFESDRAALLEALFADTLQEAEA